MRASKHLVLSVLVLAIISFFANTGWAETATGQQVVYENDFEKAIGPEWSNQITEVAPKDERRFLGQFCNDAVSLTLKDLPKHSQITVSFDLFVIRKWDGNYRQYGPDFWALSVTDGPRLLRTTFSNSKNRQSYPDAGTEGNHPPRTGADEINTLGYQWRGTPTDSVYRLSFTFSHTDNRIQFNFSGAGLERLPNESWGLDNVRVSIGDQEIEQPPLAFERRIPDYMPQQGLIALWLADGNAYDSAGQNHGRACNGVEYGAGKSGKAFRLDGEKDCVDVPVSGTFDLGEGDFSISAWFKTSSVQTQFIIDLRQNDNDPHIEIYTTNEDPRGFLGTHLLPGDVRIPYISKRVNDDVWHHVAITLDNGAIGGYNLFIDGVHVGQSTYNGKLSNWDTITIGALKNAGDRFFRGSIDEVAIWNRALSSKEIVRLSGWQKPERFEHVQVHSTRNHEDPVATGIMLEKGQCFMLEPYPQDQWTGGGTKAGVYCDYMGYDDRGNDWMRLKYQIGDGKPVPVVSGQKCYAESAGMLRLFCHDSNISGNKGRIRVFIKLGSSIGQTDERAIAH